MSTNEKYVKYELEGTLDLKTIQATIRGKEGQFFEFKENEVVESLTDLQKKTNIVTFRDVSKIPNDLIFQYSGDPKPPGTKQIWPEAGKTGKMMVEGEEKEVIAYRKV
jgi:hypothetical protein